MLPVPLSQDAKTLVHSCISSLIHSRLCILEHSVLQNSAWCAQVLAKTASMNIPINKTCRSLLLIIKTHGSVSAAKKQKIHETTPTRPVK